MSDMSDTVAVEVKERAPKEHELKTWQSYFHAVYDLSKPFEIRKDDRDFRKGDTLLLRETGYGSGNYTGRWCRRVITYVLRHEEDLGLREGFAILGLIPAQWPSPVTKKD